MRICWFSKIVLLLFCWSTLSPMLAAPIPPIDDLNGYQRSERSANLSHITGTARKMRMYVKNRYLKISTDGNVTGTNDDESEYTIFQRSSVNIGQVKIQSVATCMFLCMDTCGLIYGSRDWDDECIFNEMIEQHNYNTYSSTKYSNDRRTLYLALNKHGLPRRVQLRGKAPLGKMSMYTRVLTQPVSNKEVEELEKQPMRHHQLCPPLLDDREKRRKRNRKKKRRKCEARGAETPEAAPAKEQKKVKRKSEEPSEHKSNLKESWKKRKSPVENKNNFLYKEVAASHKKAHSNNITHTMLENATTLPVEDNTALPDLDTIELDEI